MPMSAAACVKEEELPPQCPKQSSTRDVASKSFVVPRGRRPSVSVERLFAIDAGARFIVSPGSSRELLDAADDLNIPLLPGAVTASEVMQVREAGYPVVKFFPASTSGGAPAIKAMQGPFSDMLFIPTGGVNLDNMVDYLRLANVPAVGGSWILPDTAISTEDWSTVTRLTRQAIDYATTL